MGERRVFTFWGSVAGLLASSVFLVGGGDLTSASLEVGERGPRGEVLEERSRRALGPGGWVAGASIVEKSLLRFSKKSKQGRS